MIFSKRVYERASEEDGFRVLVDRLWPRGVSKEKARIDLWFKEITPSPELRKWFGHDPAKFEVFAGRYEAELLVNPEVLGRIKDLEKEHGTVCLVYAAKDPVVNHVNVLKEVLKAF